MKKVSTKEFIWYAVCGLIAVVGLICIVFGIVGDNISKPNNFINEFENTLPLTLREFGLIFVAVGVVAVLIVLLVNAKKADRDYEKKVRREQRLAAQNNSTIEVKKAVEVVEENPAK